MKRTYPIYKYPFDDVQNHLAHFVRLDNPQSYPFDNFHAHEYNEILVFIHGGGKHNINFKNYQIKNNSIHLLAANDLHWVERSMNSTGFAIVYKNQFLQKLQMVNPAFDFCHTFSCSKVINLNTDDANDFKLIIKEMLQHNLQSAYMLQVIGAFIAKIASLDYEETPTRKIFDPIVMEVVALIEKNFKTERTIAFYAKELCLSPKTLQNRFKKASSITINQLLQQRILKEAKKLLCTTSKNIGAIAAELGFKETAHFSNWFYKKANCYPLAYKYEND